MPNIGKVPYHPNYFDDSSEWQKWRDAYKGGRTFVERYLEKFSDKETNADYTIRRTISYSPSMARPAMQDLINRMVAAFPVIERRGSSSYVRAAGGEGDGIDGSGLPMSVFLAQTVLPELMIMGNVGIYLDMSDDPTPTQASATWPYMYHYPREDILNWVAGDDGYEKLLLREHQYSYNDLGFPEKTQLAYRLFQKVSDGVLVQTFNGNFKEEREQLLELEQIPFTWLQISDSLMRDIADYQIALLNLASSDISYVLHANFPFLVQQYDRQSEIAAALASTIDDDAATVTDPDETTLNTKKVGTRHGLRYGMNLNQPAFIHPSPEPLRASMEKQEQLHREMHLLLNRSLINLKAVSASEQSRRQSDETMDAGLYILGQTLKAAEEELSTFWADYMQEDVAEIIYPTNYGTVTPEEVQQAVERYQDGMQAIPSSTYQKETAKQLVTTVLRNIPQDTIDKIYSEIDNAPSMASDAATIRDDVEAGLVSHELASKLRLYPAGEVAKAKQEHLERLAAIAISQQKGAGARGIPDATASPNDGKDEKKKSRNTDTNPTTTPPVRGESRD